MIAGFFRRFMRPPAKPVCWQSCDFCEFSHWCEMYALCARDERRFQDEFRDWKERDLDV